MSSGQYADNDLLARLNKLKRSAIDFDTQKSVGSISDQPSHKSIPIDPSPARALHETLLDRFSSLSGNSKATSSATKGPPEDSGHDQTYADEDNDKTVEELLADLGPAEQWDVGKTEQDDVEALLRSAGEALKSNPDLEQIPEDQETEAEQKPPKQTYGLPSIDIEAFQPEPDSDDDNDGRTKPSKADVNAGINDEADDVLQRLLDGVKYEQQYGRTTADTAQPPDDTTSNASSGNDNDQPPPARSDLFATNTSKAPPDTALSLPPAPSIAPTPPPPTDADTDLAARFASLSLPTALPSAPSAAPTTSASARNKPKHTDEEVETWCSICLDDAQLSCLGCDGELYCNACWVEGHRGEDAGEEERGHRAVLYSKKKGKGKGRVAMGA